MDNGDNGKHDHGVESVRVTVLSFTYNHDTHQVTIGGQPMPLSLAQMIAGEGMRLLEEQRKIAAASAMRAALVQQQRDEEIAAALRKGR